LNSATLLKVFVKSKRLLVDSLGSFKYRTISSANKDNLTFFLFCLYYFHFFLLPYCSG
jgi:hypothetical protein